MANTPHETLANAVNAYTAVGAALAKAVEDEDTDRKVKAAMLPTLPATERK